MTTGFIVGKFYPPHRGHKHLIEVARSQVEHLIVMIAHHPSQHIPGEVRLRWLQEIHPACDIRLVPDELEDDSQQWATFTLNYLGFAPDVVFSSEDYGSRFASLMGARHVMVDQRRLTVPVSGTLVRGAPLEHLDMLEPCVREWFALRVVLIGAESTGKTTLTLQLAEHFGTTYVLEYGREHWEKKVAGRSMTDPLPSWSSSEFLHIASEQQRRENLAARSAQKLLFCDTNAFATGTWRERYFQARDVQVDAIGALDRVDLYLLTTPDVPFVQDGFRDGEKIRGWMHQRFVEQLDEGKAPYVLIDGVYSERLPRAIEAVEQLLQRATSGGDKS
jgi:HTH-type transcriptional regulator, transcriptional repressor of NAD biosynthesis genes